MTLYPVFLNLAGKCVIVVGGGDVAERKVSSLLGCGAMVTVVSPEVTPRLQSLADENAIALYQRGYVSGDAVGAFLIFCASNDPELHKAVWEDARRTGALVNTVDEPVRCDFFAPAVVRQGDLIVAISTNGKSPALAAYLRHQFSLLIGREYQELLVLLAEIRTEIRQRISEFEHRKEIHYKIIETDVLGLLRRGEHAKAERLIRRVIEDYVQKKQSTG